MAIIRYYISPDHGLNQYELLEELVCSFHAESKEPIIFDGAPINRWRKEQNVSAPLLPDII